MASSTRAMRLYALPSILAFAVLCGFLRVATSSRLTTRFMSPSRPRIPRAFARLYSVDVSSSPPQRVSDSPRRDFPFRAAAKRGSGFCSSTCSRARLSSSKSIPSSSRPAWQSTRPLAAIVSGYIQPPSKSAFAMASSQSRRAPSVSPLAITECALVVSAFMCLPSCRPQRSEGSPMNSATDAGEPFIDVAFTFLRASACRRHAVLCELQAVRWQAVEQYFAARHPPQNLRVSPILPTLPQWSQ